MLKKLYCDLRARLLGTLGRWAGVGRAGRAWGAGVLQARGERSTQAGERQARGARGAGRRGRAAWARGLALGSALGALCPFSIRFDSFFFPESPNEHCSL